MVIMRERNVDKDEIGRIDENEKDVDKDEIGRIDENEKEMWIKMK